MRFLILRETVFSTFMSMLGVIFVVIGIMLGYAAFDEVDTVGLWIATALFLIIGILFYILAFKNQKKAMLRRLETERMYAEKKFDFNQKQ